MSAEHLSIPNAEERERPYPPWFGLNRSVLMEFEFVNRLRFSTEKRPVLAGNDRLDATVEVGNGRTRNGALLCLTSNWSKIENLLMTLQGHVQNSVVVPDGDWGCRRTRSYC